MNSCYPLINLKCFPLPPCPRQGAHFGTLEHSRPRSLGSRSPGDDDLILGLGLYTLPLASSAAPGARDAQKTEPFRWLSPIGVLLCPTHQKGEKTNVKRPPTTHTPEINTNKPQTGPPPLLQRAGQQGKCFFPSLLTDKPTGLSVWSKCPGSQRDHLVPLQDVREVLSPSLPCQLQGCEPCGVPVMEV